MAVITLGDLSMTIRIGIQLRYARSGKRTTELGTIIFIEFQKLRPKEFVRAWILRSLSEYKLMTGQRTRSAEG
jgi:hypothetical protein